MGEFFNRLLGVKPKQKEVRVRLDYADFYKLVNGGEVQKEGAKIILADIGFKAMKGIVDHALDSYEKKTRGGF